MRGTRLDAGSCRPAARDRVFDIARWDPQTGFSPAAVAIAEVLDWIGDTSLNARPYEEPALAFKKSAVPTSASTGYRIDTQRRCDPS